MTSRVIGARSSFAAACLALLIAALSAVPTGPVRAAAQDVGMTPIIPLSAWSRMWQW